MSNDAMPEDQAAPDPAAAAGQALPATVLLRATRSPRRLDDWALVLVAKGMHPLLRWVDGLFELHVVDAEAQPARVELAEADAEEAHATRAAAVDAAQAEEVIQPGAVFGGVAVALGLLVFFGVTGPRREYVAWFARGASEAGAVVRGEWWRTVTALTLHADIAHVLSNVGLGAVVVAAVMRARGVGLGALLVLASGAAGNLLNAWLHRSAHSTVGFSTAVFGAIGLLGGLGYMRLRRRPHRSRPAWTALAGGFALLALMGSSERSDVLAHFFGALAGLVLGMVAGTVGQRPARPAVQWTAMAATVAIIGWSWFRALP
jgi:rhomboid protease GluP